MFAPHIRQMLASTSVADANAHGQRTGLTRRLRWDHEVSFTTPVVDGTWVTAVFLADMFKDGMSFDNILRRYPEIVQEDIDECLRWVLANPA